MKALRHYVYYRVDAGDADAAVAAAQAVQARLRAEHPGLQAELLKRPGLRDGQVTLMETYAFAPQQDAAAVESQAAAATAGWRRGPRHVEVFERLGR